MSFWKNPEQPLTSPALVSKFLITIFTPGTLGGGWRWPGVSHHPGVVDTPARLAKTNFPRVSNLHIDSLVTGMFFFTSFNFGSTHCPWSLGGLEFWTGKARRLAGFYPEYNLRSVWLPQKLMIFVRFSWYVSYFGFLDLVRGCFASFKPLSWLWVGGWGGGQLLVVWEAIPGFLWGIKGFPVQKQYENIKDLYRQGFRRFLPNALFFLDGVKKIILTPSSLYKPLFPFSGDFCMLAILSVVFLHSNYGKP